MFLRKRKLFERRFAQFKLLDGLESRCDMRSELRVALESYLDTYPQAETLLQVRKSRFGC